MLLQPKIIFHFILQRIGFLDIKMKKKLPKYIQILVNKYPYIASGRKNFKEHHIRIFKTIELIKKHLKSINN